MDLPIAMGSAACNSSSSNRTRSFRPGPALAAAPYRASDQNTTISQQLSLWNQQGSRVIRGKQIVTPIENSFLYVVPLYLKAEGTNFPQLKRVIAIAADKVVMEPTLDEALSALSGALGICPIAGPSPMLCGYLLAF